jgi:Flp pilus assembly protein TadG
VTGSWRPLAAFRRDDSAVAAIEFALVAAPFFLLLIATIQIGIWYFAQSALNTGVLQTAQTLYSSFRTGTAASLMNAGALKTSVVGHAGGMIHNDGTLAVEIRQIGALSSGTVAITDGVSDYGLTRSTLVIRAQSQVVCFIPGMSGVLYVTSSAIVRRQGT